MLVICTGTQHIDGSGLPERHNDIVNSMAVAALAPLQNEKK
jgi:hypothetical protein